MRCGERAAAGQKGGEGRERTPRSPTRESFIGHPRFSRCFVQPAGAAGRQDNGCGEVLFRVPYAQGRSALPRDAGCEDRRYQRLRRVVGAETEREAGGDHGAGREPSRLRAVAEKVGGRPRSRRARGHGRRGPPRAGSEIRSPGHRGGASAAIRSAASSSWLASRTPTCRARSARASILATAAGAMMKQGRRAWSAARARARAIR